jgi:hypothetical protein
MTDVGSDLQSSQRSWEDEDSEDDGHVAVFEEDSACVEFSPQREYDAVVAHVGRKAQA